MNLYDRDDGFRIFSLQEANLLLPDVIKITAIAAESLEDAKMRMKSEEIDDNALAQRKFEKETAAILKEWSQEISALGIYPKGFFTVDFKSPIPDTLFCWGYGEEVISHTHKIFETFKDRMPIRNNLLPGFEDLLN
ncbi:DUF2203 family protein [candidate division KSB1 bacterium]|nr:DUF2203 family protein [candidate division KSB1 bacterium]TDI92231.1 MAG: DUF2203 family protein [Caldithrix sp.]TDJ04011.1 MAG: DUF2203 family protein [Caldithrix sp.]